MSNPRSPEDHNQSAMAECINCDRTITSSAADAQESPRVWHHVMSHTPARQCDESKPMGFTNVARPKPGTLIR